jgi:hypothetical protein
MVGLVNGSGRPMCAEIVVIFFTGVISRRRLTSPDTSPPCRRSSANVNTFQ